VSYPFPSSPDTFGHDVTQRLHRIVAVRAIHGASGAMHFNNSVRFSILFTAGTMTGGTPALTVRHRNASTPSGPSAPPGHTLMQRPHPVQAGGHIVDVMERGTVTSLEGYNAVIIGAPMYMGKMIDTVKFVTRLRDGLMKLPVAGFIVSLAPVSKDPVHMENSQKALHASHHPLLPEAETVFAGSLDPKNLSWFQRWMTKSVKAPVGDFRDWDAIAAWAKELPGKMDL